MDITTTTGTATCKETFLGGPRRGERCGEPAEYRDREGNTFCVRHHNGLRVLYAIEFYDREERTPQAVWAEAEAEAPENGLVTEEYCYICNRLTDHRGEH